MWRKLLLGFLFALTFAYVESSVVVYLRGIYYPSQYHLFPLVRASTQHIFIELGREFSTLVILFSVGMAIGRLRFWPSVLYFFFIFGLWDILYYFWLYIFIGWPPHPMEWDVLFLIPVPWLAPLICPVLVALLFVTSAIYIPYVESLSESKPDKNGLLIWILGSFVVFISFILKSIILLLKGGEEALLTFVPGRFYWELYIPGLVLMIFGWFRMLRKLKGSL